MGCCSESQHEVEIKDAQKELNEQIFFIINVQIVFLGSILGVSLSNL
jgi:hypothetical protein